MSSDLTEKVLEVYHQLLMDKSDDISKDLRVIVDGSLCDDLYCAEVSVQEDRIVVLLSSYAETEKARKDHHETTEGLGIILRRLIDLPLSIALCPRNAK